MDVGAADIYQILDVVQIVGVKSSVFVFPPVISRGGLLGAGTVIYAVYVVPAGIS